MRGAILARLQETAFLPAAERSGLWVRPRDAVIVDATVPGLLAAPCLRAGLVEPTRVLLADGRHADVPSYTAWWLRRHPVLGGHRPTDVRVAGTDPLLAGLYDEATLPADPVVARALGVRTSLAELLAEPGGPDELLDRLADPGRPVTRAQLRALWAALAAVGGAAPPDRVRAVCGDEVVVADAEDALVLDAADLWPLVAAQPLVLAPTTGHSGSLICWTCRWSRRRSPAGSSRHQHAAGPRDRARRAA